MGNVAVMRTAVWTPARSWPFVPELWRVASGVPGGTLR